MATQITEVYVDTLYEKNQLTPRKGLIVYVGEDGSVWIGDGQAFQNENVVPPLSFYEEYNELFDAMWTTSDIGQGEVNIYQVNGTTDVTPSQIESIPDDSYGTLWYDAKGSALTFEVLSKGLRFKNGSDLVTINDVPAGEGIFESGVATYYFKQDGGTGSIGEGESTYGFIMAVEIQGETLVDFLGYLFAGGNSSGTAGSDALRFGTAYDEFTIARNAGGEFVFSTSILAGPMIIEYYVNGNSRTMRLNGEEVTIDAGAAWSAFGKGIGKFDANNNNNPIWSTFCEAVTYDTTEWGAAAAKLAALYGIPYNPTY